MALDPKRSTMLSMDLQAGIVSVCVKNEGLSPRPLRLGTTRC